LAPFVLIMVKSILSPVCLLEISFFFKVNYFLLFGSVIKNKLDFIVFSYIMENELENNLLMFYFFQVY